MRASLSWLREHVNLDGLTAPKIADLLSLSGTEVEGIEQRWHDGDNIVVAKIVARAQHPDADRLSVCTVDDGSGETLQIVCGAPNAREGLFVPLARVGARLPDGLEIKKGRLRGVDSYGMLCSARELGLSSANDGLLELPEALVPGTPIAEALGLRETVLTVGVTPNRPDCLGIVGLARELAAVSGQLRHPLLATLPLGAGASTVSRLPISIADPTGCPRYAGIVIDGLRVGPSPQWLASRIEALGQRSINNIVDVTNWVLLELSQPLHAFDVAKLAGPRIDVRRAADGESFEGLDGVVRALQSSDLVIADVAGPVALAGVMGGMGSSVTETTTSILIECACFDPSTVRKTARRLGMHTESSHRFERGVDCEGIPLALARAVQLVLRTQDGIAGAAPVVSSASVDAYPTRWERTRIAFDGQHPTRLIGVPISTEEVRALLTRLDLVVEGEGDALTVTVPGFRRDLQRPVDLVEEIGRLRGYDALPTHLPSLPMGALPVRRDDAPFPQRTQPIQTSAWLDDTNRVRDALTTLGLHEAVNWAMVDPMRHAAAGGRADAHRLVNPLGQETSTLRTTLLAGLLNNVSYNLARGNPRIALFEMGWCSLPDRDGETEPLHVAAVLCGAAADGWSASPRAFDGHDAVDLVQAVAQATGRTLSVVAGEDAPAHLHPGVWGKVQLGQIVVGTVGAIHPDALDVWEIDAPVVAMEIDLQALLAVVPAVVKAKGAPRTPGVTRDIALVVPMATAWQQVDAALAGFEGKLLASWRLADVYTGAQVAPGSQSLTVRLVYQRDGESLTDEQVDRVHSRLVAHLGGTLGATLRA